LLECAPEESRGSENLGLHWYGQESRKLVPLVLSELQGGKSQDSRPTKDVQSLTPNFDEVDQHDNYFMRG
jgi:hypothetical protein